MTNIRFEKAIEHHKSTIFEWLDAPHIKEFWDNSPEHRQDIEIFMAGRTEESSYFNGINSYWIGLIDDEPYSLLLTHEESEETNTPDHFKPYLSKTGKTAGLDFGIGSKKYIGKGLAAPTLIPCLEINASSRYKICPYCIGGKTQHIVYILSFAPYAVWAKIEAN